MGENKIGLVLEGGGMRGMYTCGILDVLMNEGIEFGGAAGVSAGAAFGCNYKSRQPGRALRYNKRFAGDPRYSGLRSLLRTGNLFNAEFCYHVVPTEYDVFDTATFASNPMAFYAVCMDVDTGKAVYHRCTDGGYTDLEWIRASASMPIVSRVVEIDGHRYLDGGLADNIPLEFMQQQGYARNVVILTQADDYRKQQSRAMPLPACCCAATLPWSRRSRTAPRTTTSKWSKCVSANALATPSFSVPTPRWPSPAPAATPPKWNASTT